jgi:hypothetical protein
MSATPNGASDQRTCTIELVVPGAQNLDVERVQERVGERQRQRLGTSNAGPAEMIGVSVIDERLRFLASAEFCCEIGEKV